MGLSEIDRRWLQTEVFFWAAPWHVGRGFVENLFYAVDNAFNGRRAAAEQHYQAANQTYHFTGGPQFNFYLDALLRIARGVIDSGTLPSKVTRPLHEMAPGTILVLERPVPVPEEKRKDYEAFMRELSAIDIAAYKASRGPEIDKARQDLLAGRIDSSQAPELASQAMTLRREVSASDKAAKQELAVLQAKRDDATKRRNEAAARLNEGEAEATLAGLKKSWKRLRKNIKRGWDDAVDPVRKLRDTISHALIPSVARDFGKKIDRERKRFGRRIDKQLQRTVAQVAENAPWLHAIAPLFAIVPGVGWAFTILVSSAVATAEIAFALKQKKAIDENLRKSKKLLLAEIAALEAEARALNERALELERLRQEVLRKAEEERAARLARAAELERLATRRRRVIVLGSFAIVGGLSVARRRGRLLSEQVLMLGGLGLGALAFWSWQQSRKEREHALLS